MLIVFLSTPGNTELHGILRVEGMPCSNCVLNSYLVSNDKVKDAVATNTDNTGFFTATVTDWHCTAGVSYRGAVKVSRAGNNHYALVRATADEFFQPVEQGLFV